MTSSGLGSLLGMRHALEPDHLAAVSTLVSGERSGYKAAFLGACWGLGHTLALVAVGLVVVMLRAELPVRVSNLFEFGVAIMLVGLGVRAIYLAARQGPPLVIGLCEGEQFLASDPAALLVHTKDVIFLENGDLARLTPAGVEVWDKTGKTVTKDYATTVGSPGSSRFSRPRTVGSSRDRSCLRR